MQRKADPRPFISSVGRSFEGTGDKMTSWAAMTALALFTGFVVGFVIYLILNLSGWLTALIWERLAGRLGIPIFSLLACTVGGIVIGLWTYFSHNSIDDLDTVLGEFSQTGSYRLENPAATAVSFLLPLMFGGSVGFEAGLTGIICAGCCWVRDKLKLAGLRAANIMDVTVSASLSAIFRAPLAGLVAGYESEGNDALSTELGHVDDYNMRREVKLVLYLAAAIGSLGGIVAFTSLFGGSSGMPRFDPIAARGVELLWAIPCLCAAYLLLLVFYATEHACALVSKRIGEGAKATICKPIAAGMVLGTIALILPLVLFPGEEQSHELMRSWTSMGTLVLLATGILKAFVTPLCIGMGWKGGDLFPCIFAGVSTGYGLAAITGADPMLMVTITTTAFLAGVTRKPVLALGILMLCFPVSGVLWMGLAALAGAALPLPRFMMEE
ncbi:MAG: chloride channel protein [Atopobiaceae bacterium]|nr:chloride channel protein [Atopobiaceae bacterium]